MTDADDANPVAVELAGTTLRATDVAGNSIAFELTGWDRLSTAHEFDAPIDAAAVGRVTELRYDLRNVLTVDRLDGPLTLRKGSSDDGACSVDGDSDVEIALPDGRYDCRLEMPLFVRLRFDGEARISNRSRGGLTVSFPHPTPVTFGFTSPVDVPRHELTVEPTVDGVATGLSHLSSSIETTAERVHRYYRAYPPRLSIGAETHVPDAVRETTPETGIELEVPDRLAALFPAAPLAYYLGVTLVPAEVTTPVIRAPRVDLRHEFDALPAFGTEVTALLRRTFFLDLLAAWIDPGEPTVEAHERLEAAGVDLEGCADGTPAQRLATYLEFPAETVDAALPPWPYRMTVEPTVDHAPALPHLLYDMAAIDLPERPTAESAPRDGRARAAGSGGDRAPGERGDDRGTGESSAVDDLVASRGIRGVLGDVGDATGFSALACAYDHRLDDLERECDERSVTVVFADDAVDDATRESAVERYARRSGTVSPSVDRLDDPTREELAGAFAEGADFLHYVGGCDGSRLACRDGHLRPSALGENGVRLFQLDAPDSLAAGKSLVEAGSVAGVTCPGSEPGDVSTTIGELVLYGQCLASARACAGAGADDGVDARRAVVGAGTHRFVAKWQPSVVHALVTDADGRVDATTVPFPVDPVGCHWLSPRPDDKRLQPAPIAHAVDPEDLVDLVAYFETAGEPVSYDGRLYWPEELNRLLYPIA